MNSRRFLLGAMLVGILFTWAACRKDDASIDEQQIREIYNRYSAAVASKDINTIISFYVPGERLVVFDAFLPRQYVGAAAYRKDYEDFFANFPGATKSDVSDLHITTAGTLGFAYGIDHWVVTGTNGPPLELVLRFTDAFEKVNGNWLITHEHVSVPVDPMTGKADFLSKP
ncbi:MAG: nuclear transport factor 2 family protein [Bacteroidetes bacterium]|nr:nuclear transport factor 2 family protein [Bacteroidota bacterium]